MFNHWKDFFHPHEGNDHHPHAYRKISAIALACVVGLVLVVTAAQTGYVHNSDTFLSSVLPSVLIDLTNENRQSEGLADLEPNKTLQRAAQLKANHMAEEGYFAHDSPTGVTPWEWFEEAGYTYKTAGENLAIDFTDSDAVVEAWMDSRLHRENILEEDFTEIGIATAESEYQGRDTVFVVQMFGTPDEKELAERESESSSDETTQTDESQATSTDELVAELQNEVNQVQQEVAQQDQEVEGTQQEEQVSDGPENEQQPDEETTDKNRLAQHSETSSESSNAGQEDGQKTTAEKVTTSTETTKTQQPPTTTTTTQPHFQPDTFATPTPVGQVQGLSGVSLIPSGQANGFAHVLSQPQLVYKIAFAGIAGLILLVLLISIAVEAKHHHWKLAGYSLLTLVVLLGVFYAGSQLLFVEPTVAGIAY